MKITGLETAILRIPEADPLADMPEDGSRLRPFVTLRLRTDEGIEGIAFTLYGDAMTGSLRTAVDELGALCIGEDPRDIERIGQKLMNAVGAHCGPGGIFTLAASAIDIALWDIKAISNAISG